MLTTTTSFSTAFTVVHFHQVSPPRIEHYKQYPWFRNKLKLLQDITFAYWKAKHTPELPNRSPRQDPDAWEAVDPYFLEQMKLEKKGWQSFSISEYSRNELARIRRWLKKREPFTFIMDEHPDCDIYAFVGCVETLCTSATVHPSLVDDFADFLYKMSFERPCLLITKELTKEMKDLLPTNRHILAGTDATAVSFSRTPNYQRLADLCSM